MRYGSRGEHFGVTFSLSLEHITKWKNRRLTTTKLKKQKVGWLERWEAHKRDVVKMKSEKITQRC